MEEKDFYTFDEVKDELLGKVGTPERDSYETELQSFLVGEAIKQARQKQQLTQQTLAERIGVGRSQVSKIENGRNVTLATMSRIFKALGLEASLNVAGVGSFAL